MNKPYFVTGIGTEIGKTIVSAILVEKLKADYWKPIQSGDLEHSDTIKVRKLITNSTSKFHEEAYRLTQPFSPHYSAQLDGIQIDLNQINIPQTKNNLIIEGAGGLMVPLNQEHLMIDLIQKLGISVIIVSKNYLGSINHTLLTIEALKSREIDIEGLIFNGEPTKASEDIISKISNLKILGRLPQLEFIDANTIKNCGKLIEI